MDHHDEKQPSAPSAAPTAPAAGRDKLKHLLRTAQGNAANRNHKTSHKRPSPSMPTLPWNEPSE